MARCSIQDGRVANCDNDACPWCLCDAGWKPGAKRKRNGELPVNARKKRKGKR